MRLDTFHKKFTCTVWPEILAGRYFGGLLKICHLAEFTLAVEPVLAIMIFIAKWLIERAGNLTWPWASFRSVGTKSMIKCNCKLTKSLLRLIWTVFVPSVFTANVYTSFESPSSRWQTSQLFSFGVQNSLEKRCSRTQLSMVNSILTIRLARLAAAKYTDYDFAIMMTSHCEVFGGWNIGGLLSKPPICQNKFPAKISGHTVSYFWSKMAVSPAKAPIGGDIRCELAYSWKRKHIQKLKNYCQNRHFPCIQGIA